ncbi:hypothetical protein GCM10010232_59050 [Streptomyces amakusaensis]|uniref:Signal protein n=1 Tax=Streptomyces amakusaensis TaxID=67271 RepID=A0ABW0ARF4_9ACTN
MRLRAGIVVMALAAVVGCGGGGSTDAGTWEPEPDPTPVVVESPKPATHEGRLPTRELQGRWWSWVAAEPLETNPYSDPDGSQCGRNQGSDVWFLAGATGGSPERVCDVPAGQPIAFPVVNTHGSREDCADFMYRARGIARLNGDDLAVEEYHGEEITITGKAGNPVVDPGTTSSIACGLWVQLPPLDPGKHSVEIFGESWDLKVKLGYTLTVKAGPAVRA